MADLRTGGHDIDQYSDTPYADTTKNPLEHILLSVTQSHRKPFHIFIDRNIYFIL